MAFSLKSLFKRKEKDSAAYDADDDDSFAPKAEKSRKSPGKKLSGKKKPASSGAAASGGGLQSLLGKIPFLKAKGVVAAGPDPFDDPQLLALIASELEALPPPEVSVPPADDFASDPLSQSPPSSARAADPFSVSEEPVLRATTEDPGYPAEDDFSALGGVSPEDPFATDEADEIYRNRRRRRTVMGLISTAALVLVLGAGLFWLFGSSEPEPWVAEGLTVLNEKGVPIAVPPAEAVVSGTRVTMAMPPPPKAPLQAKTDPASALGTEKSTARRPWLQSGQDAPAAPGEAAPAEAAVAAQAEKPTEPTAPPADPNAGKPKVVDPMAALPMLVDPLGPTLRAAGGKTPSYAGLPDLKVPPAPLKEAPDPDLAKRSPLGILPILGRDGRASWQAYAHPFKVQPPLPASAPKVSVIVGGLGMNPDATDTAIRKLPPEVTLAFSPYSPRLDEFVKKARANGHEVMLEVPLEPENFPSQDPGPLGLLTILPQIDNLTRLETILGKTTGYVGLLGRMGGKFGASPVHMRPVLEALTKYGVMYVHTASPKGLGDMRGIAVPVVQNIVMVDDRPFRDAFDARLSYLVTVAKQRGTAVGVTNPSPMAYDRLLAWMATLQAQGVVFAPVSATTGIPAG